MAKVVQNQNGSKFSTDRTYKWEENDIFEITGMQLAHLFHALHQEMNDKGGAPALLKYNAYQVVMDVLKKGVEQGVVVENDASAEVNKGVKALFPSAE